MKKSERTRGDAASNTWLQWMVRLLRGGLLAILVTPLCLLIGAYCISRGFLAQPQMTGMVYGSCVLGSLCGGIFAIGRQGARSLPLGLCIGIILFLFYTMGGFLCFEVIEWSSGGVGILLACLCGGTMAGILCRKRQKRGR